MKSQHLGSLLVIQLEIRHRRLGKQTPTQHPSPLLAIQLEIYHWDCELEKK